MPEGPECRLVRDYLHGILASRILIELGILSGRYTKDPGTLPLLKLPSKIIRVGNKGKLIWIELENQFLVINLGLTGTFCTDQRKHNHIALIFQEDQGDRNIVFFNDFRNFGLWQVATQEILLQRVNQLGPDLMDPNVSFEIFLKRLLENENQSRNYCLINT